VDLQEAAIRAEGKGMSGKYKKERSSISNTLSQAEDIAKLTMALGELAAALARAEDRWSQLAARQMELEQSFLELKPIVEIAKSRLMSTPQLIPTAHAVENGDADDDETDKAHDDSEQ
jgi:hypothetical protein